MRCICLKTEPTIFITEIFNSLKKQPSFHTLGEFWFDWILFSKFINKLLELFSAVSMMQVSR